jgi:hypothetical protein
MIATPLKDALLRFYSVAPQYLGRAADVHVVTQDGRRLVDIAGSLREVIVATASDVASSGLAEGVYLVGSGNTGAAATFFTLGGAYAAVMSVGAMSYRVPAENWKPDGWQGPQTASAYTSSSMISAHHVHIDQALKTPQFWGLWTCLCMNVTAGIGVIGVAKTMMTDMFGAAAAKINNVPLGLQTILGAGTDGIVNASTLAANYVLAISVFNMVGRLGWASVSDVIGRRNTYFLFFCGGIPLYLAIPHIAAMAPGLPSLALFYGATMVIFRSGAGCMPAPARTLSGDK